MKRVTVAVAFLLLPTVALAAPAPFPKPGLSREQEALLEEAEREMNEASDLQRSFGKDVGLRRTNPNALGGVLARARVLYRNGAEKLARLDEALVKNRVAWQVREPVARKAGKAWQTAGEYGRALAVYAEVLRLSANPEARVEAAAGTAACRLCLGQTVDARKALAGLRKELPQLKAEDREKWRQCLERAERELEEKRLLQGIDRLMK